MQNNSCIKDIGIILGAVGKLLYTYPKYEDYKAFDDSGFFTDIPIVEGNKFCGEGARLLIDWGAVPFSKEVFDAISADYIRLFVGGGDAVQAPPWESVYINPDPQLFQHSTLDIRRRYLKYGMVVENLHSEPDDHIGLELLFVSHLIVSLHESKNAAVQLNDIKDFTAKHLANWAPHFCDIVIGAAKTDLFKGLAFFAKGGILELSSYFDLKVEVKVYR